MKDYFCELRGIHKKPIMTTVVRNIDSTQLGLGNFFWFEKI